MAAFAYVVVPSALTSQTPSNMPSKIVRSRSAGTWPTEVLNPDRSWGSTALGGRRVRDDAVPVTTRVLVPNGPPFAWLYVDVVDRGDNPDTPCQSPVSGRMERPVMTARHRPIKARRRPAPRLRPRGTPFRPGTDDTPETVRRRRAAIKAREAVAIAHVGREPRAG